MISYLLPTRNRPEPLRETLEALGCLSGRRHQQFGGAEVIVVDNDSSPPAICPQKLANDFPVRLLRLEHNAGAAGRNAGAEIAAGNWLVMLDDDSHPLTDDHLDVLAEAPKDLLAIGAEILLDDDSHEAGGLPEVIIGCGAAFEPPPKGLRGSLKEESVALEWMDTGAACRTFNVLLAEDRAAAVALIAVE